VPYFGLVSAQVGVCRRGWGGGGGGVRVRVGVEKRCLGVPCYALLCPTVLCSWDVVHCLFALWQANCAVPSNPASVYCHCYCYMVEDGPVHPIGVLCCAVLCLNCRVPMPMCLPHVLMYGTISDCTVEIHVLRRAVSAVLCCAVLC
jgi:hypothetical protein